MVVLEPLHDIEMVVEEEESNENPLTFVGTAF